MKRIKFSICCDILEINKEVSKIMNNYKSKHLSLIRKNGRYEITVYKGELYDKQKIIDGDNDAM